MPSHPWPVADSILKTAQCVQATAGQACYPVWIGGGLFACVGELCARIGWHGRVMLITHPRLAQIYWPAIATSLARCSLEAHVVEIPEGEESKSLTTATTLYDRLHAAGADRDTPMLALGGGVVGDVAGFVAATYHRGMPLVHLPTTLLAQIDSSIGGKTAVNYRHLKNQIGVFYQPALVVADLSALESLSPRQVQSGMAEAVKYAMIADATFFSYLEEQAHSLLLRQHGPLLHTVATCVRIKAMLVASDEKDRGPRRLLNFGHTIGHALEAVSDFSLTHGEAVAIGMVAACRMARRLGMFGDMEIGRLVSLLQKLGLPVGIPEVAGPEVMAALRHDKKNSFGRIRFVLPVRIGEAVIVDDVPPALVMEVLTGKS